MDLHASAVRTFTRACDLLLKDLEALPETAFGQKFGNEARTVADITYEVILVNRHVGITLRKEEPFAWPDDGWITAPEGCRTKEECMSAFQSMKDELLQTLESLKIRSMDEAIQTETGESTIYAQCNFMCLHMWYHSGQLNFIQTLLGDKEWHWQ